MNPTPLITAATHHSPRTGAYKHLPEKDKDTSHHRDRGLFFVFSLIDHPRIFVFFCADPHPRDKRTGSGHGAVLFFFFVCSHEEGLPFGSVSEVFI